MQTDLFGNVTPEPTPDERYAAYINSAKWKQRCDRAIAQAGYRCQRCGFTKYSRRLEVHHLTYERLGHERDEDLQVVCHECHVAADQERAAVEEQRKHTGTLAAGFEAWMDRGNNAGWRRWSDSAIQREWASFIQHINRLRRTRYPINECPLLRTAAPTPDPYRGYPMPRQPSDPNELPFTDAPEPEEM